MNRQRKLNERERMAYATIARLEAERERLQARIAELEQLSVTSVLLDVVPGLDGMGEEIFATSVDQVRKVFTQLYERIENLEAQACKR